MKKIVLSLIAIVTCFALNAETWTLGGTDYTWTIGETRQLGSATTYSTGRLTVSGSPSLDMTIFYTITDLTNQNVEARVVPANKTSFALKTVSNTANTITDATPIAGINAGFFNMTPNDAAYKYPLGLQVIDGKARKGFSGDGFYTIAFDNSNKPHIGYLNKTESWLSNLTTGEDGIWTSDSAAINSTPTYVTNCEVYNQVIVYTPEYGPSGTSGTGGYAVQLTPAYDHTKLTPGDGEYSQWKVACAPTTGNLTAPSNGIVLYGKNTPGTFVSKLKVNDIVNISLIPRIKDNNGTITSPVCKQAAGGSLMILNNGNVITSYANKLGDINIKAPRTAIGYNADKTKLVMLVVDGRNTNWTNGCNGIVLGDIMKKLGCSDALNLDGGGSSQFWTSHGGLVNDAARNGDATSANPTYIRPVAETIFIVELPTPVLSTSTNTLSFNTSDNATVSNQVTISGTNLRGDITLTLSGTNADQFTVSTTSIAKASGSGTVTVTYKPTKFGSHSATLTITTQQYTNKTVTKTITLSGTNTEVVVNPPAEEPEEPETPVEPEEPGITKPTLTTVWENTSANLPTNGRYATAFNGNIYISDYSNKKIVKVSGKEDSNVVDYMTNDAFLGSAITSDQAGNIIISNSGTGNNTTLNNWAIIPAGSTSEVKKISIPTPSAVTAGRVDQVGRIIGNIASVDGGYMYMTPNENKIAICAKIANNQVSAVNSSSEFRWAFSSSNIGQPMLSSVSGISSTPNYADYMYTKTRSSETIFYIKNQASAYYTVTKDEANVNGFDVFELCGVKYVVYPTSNLSFNVAILENNTVVATEEDTNTHTAQYNSFVAEVVSETKANIYQYNCGKKAAMYTFEVPAGNATAIEEVMAEVEVPVEYYNLQGVRVMNPESGLYIKRQGNKITKVIL